MRRALGLVAGSALLLALPAALYAQSATSTTDTLQAQINANNDQIAQLDREIQAYQQQLDATTKQKNTLQNTVNQLNLNIKKTTASIKVTQNQINSTELQIKQLTGNISDTQGSIDTEQAGLAQSLRRLAEIESQPLSLMLLSEGGITGAWNDLVALSALQSAVNDHIQNLSTKKQQLTDTKTAAEQKHTQLLAQQRTLQTQQGSLAAQQKAQSDLLAQTKNQEANYQSIIAQKKSQEADLETALSDLKAKYNVAVNVNQITAPGQGILQWPIQGTIRITQYFGNTPFSQTHASLYSGHGHDGLDIAAPIGTPVHAALAGVVIGTGNTDAVRGCYSFGKWVMIKHNNGLNTMYAHLSQIAVYQGESLNTGDVLGYSGETGYATGPHLHFGVYVSSVTQILALGQATNSKTPCATAVMPVPPLSGYLNPLNYLPAT
jgi:murein DD-endopeptidase MepM/ murein hydrolase activator NlpD